MFDVFRALDHPDIRGLVILLLLCASFFIPVIRDTLIFPKRTDDD